MSSMRRGGIKLVLVVEDSPTQAIHLQSLLEKVGLRCMLASNGQTGLYLAQTLLPDLVIMDLEMPQMNGYQVAEALKADSQTAQIPIIMMTRHDEADAVVKGMEAGAMEYIPKDASADAVLLETLRQMKVIAKAG